MKEVYRKVMQLHFENGYVRDKLSIRRKMIKLKYLNIWVRIAMKVDLRSYGELHVNSILWSRKLVNYKLYIFYSMTICFKISARIHREVVAFLLPLLIMAMFLGLFKLHRFCSIGLRMSMQPPRREPIPSLPGIERNLRGERKPIS